MGTANPQATQSQGSEATDTLIDEGFARSIRLLKKADFEKVLKQREITISAAPFQLLARQGDATRLGIVVGKRFLARAHDRNLVKRIVRESFRRCRTRLPRVDLVVMLRQRPGQCDRAKLREQIEALWQGLIAKSRMSTGKSS